jgi:mycothiol synthase
MKIRLYRNADFQSALKIISLTHHLDNVTESIFREKLTDDPGFNPNLTFISEVDGNVAGFMQGVIRDVRGDRIAYIKLMGVLEEYRRMGLACSLFTSLEKKATEEGASLMRIYDSVLNYLSPGIDPRYTPALCFAERMGFRRFTDTCNMHAPLNRDLDTSQKENDVKKHGITICRAEPQYYDSLMDFIEEHFDLWRYEIKMAWKNAPVSIHIALENNSVSAFSAHSANNAGSSWFGPMGTHPRLRGKGVGSILLKRCLNDLKQAGHDFAIIPWVGPVSFYSQHCDAVISRVFWRYEKSIDA